MCFRLIDAKRAQHPVSLLCSVLGVSRAGYYAWKDRPACARRRRDDELLERDRRDPRREQGHLRLAADPRRAAPPRRAREPQARRAADAPGRAVGHGAPAQGLAPRSRCRASPPRRISCAATSRRPAPNRLWVADLTEIATWEGKLYLAVVVDCFSRRCVGWAMAEHMRAELVVEALEMAIWQRRPRRRTGPSQRQGRPVRVADLRPDRPRRRHRRLDGRQGLRARQRRLRGVLRHAQEGAHAPTLLADAPRAPERRVRVDRRLVQPPPAALHARLPLAASTTRTELSASTVLASPLRGSHTHQHDQGEGCVDQPQRVHRNGSGPRLMPRRPTIGSVLAAARCRHVPEGSRLGEMLRRTGTGRRASTSARIPETTARDEQQAACRAPTARSLRWKAAICAGHRRRRAGRSAATHCRSWLRVAGAASRPTHGAPHRRASSAEAHGIVSDSRMDRRGDDSNCESTRTGSRDRLRLCAAPRGVSRDYGPFSAPRPDQAIPGPDEQVFNMPEPRDPAFIGHCGRWRDPDTNREHREFQTDASNHRTGRSMPAGRAGFYRPAQGRVSRNSARM